MSDATICCRKAKASEPATFFPVLSTYDERPDANDTQTGLLPFAHSYRARPLVPANARFLPSGSPRCGGGDGVVVECLSRRVISTTTRRRPAPLCFCRTWPPVHFAQLVEPSASLQRFADVNRLQHTNPEPSPLTFLWSVSSSYLQFSSVGLGGDK